MMAPNATTVVNNPLDALPLNTASRSEIISEQLGA
jgi:hypothetical protein